MNPPATRRTAALAYLAKHGPTLGTDIARAIDTDPGNINTLARPLLEAGFVTKEILPGHRAYTFAITDAGRAQVPAEKQAIEEETGPRFNPADPFGLASKVRARPCEICGQAGKHAIDCPVSHLDTRSTTDTDSVISTYAEADLELTVFKRRGVVLRAGTTFINLRPDQVRVLRTIVGMLPA